MCPPVGKLKSRAFGMCSEVCLQARREIARVAETDRDSAELSLQLLDIEKQANKHERYGNEANA